MGLVSEEIRCIPAYACMSLASLHGVVPDTLIMHIIFGSIDRSLQLNPKF